MPGRRVLGEAERLVEIATVLWASGFGWLVAALGLGACVSPRCRLLCSLRPAEQCPHHVAMDVPLPERMALVLERLGPTFVKLGQILALRPDYVPIEYSEALRRLHDHVAPFDGSVAVAVVERELGAPVSELFASFGREPIASASLSQVHRAVLPDGRAVAVKVQRPGAREAMQRDLELLEVLARRLERRVPDALGFRPSAAVAELSDTTARELDFRREARTAMRLRRELADDERIVIPWIDHDRTTSHVLTMELIAGQPPAPATALEDAGFDVQQLLQTGARAMLRQLFEIGTFHADPHPGNVLFLPGNRVAFIDFGMFGRLGIRERRRMAFVLWALVEGDFDAVGDQLLPFAEVTASGDVRAFREAVADIVEDWAAAREPRESVARMLLHQLSAGARYGIVFPRDLMLVARALVGVDATTTLVAPEIPFAELVRPLLDDLRTTLAPGPAQLQDALERRRFDYLQVALDLPDLLVDRLGEHTTRGPRHAMPEPTTPVSRVRPRIRSLVAGMGLGIAIGELSRRRGAPASGGLDALSRTRRWASGWWPRRRR